MHLVIVRHGRTDANARGLLLGRSDVELDSVGRAQAERLAEAVGPVERIVSSPLARARQTAEAIGGPRGLGIAIEPRLIELDYGDYDGRAFDEVPTDTWTRWRSDLTFAPPGGESLHDLGLRVRAFLDQLTAEPSDATVVLVSHVSPIKAAVAWALDAGDELTWRLHVAPASISRVDVGRRGAVLVSFDEAGHLEG